MTWQHVQFPSGVYRVRGTDLVEQNVGFLNDLICAEMMLLYFLYWVGV